MNLRLRLCFLLSAVITAAVFVLRGIGAEGAEPGMQTVYVAVNDPQQSNLEFANAICKAINKDRKKNNLSCKVRTDNKADQGQALQLVQCDQYYYKKNYAGHTVGLKAFEPLYALLLSVVVKEGSGFTTASGLLANKVTIGISRPYAEDVVRAIIQSAGIASPVVIKKMQRAQLGESLCSNKIDAAVFLANHPDEEILEITKGCGIRILPLEAFLLESVVKKNNFYIAAQIPGGIYPGNPWDIDALGVEVLLAVPEGFPADFIDKISGSINQNLSVILPKNMDYVRKSCPMPQYVGIKPAQAVNNK